MRHGHAAVALVGLCALAAPRAQEAVAVQSALAPRTTRRAADWLAERLPDLRITVEPAAAHEVVQAVRARAADVVLGLDALLAYELAREGLLAPAEAEAAGGLPTSCRGPRQTFVVPLLAPLAIAFDGRALAREEAPSDYEDLLFDPRYGGRIALCTPAGLPALWAGLVQLQLAQGFGEDQAFRWLLTLDARVSAYEPSSAAALGALAEQRAAISVLPVGEVLLAADRGVELTLPASGMLPQGLAVAIVAGRDGERARRVHAALVTPAFAAAMVESNLVPAPRDDLPDTARGWMAGKLRPFEPAYADAPIWFARWRDEVRGRGRDFGWLELLLDGLFAVGFAAFLFVLYRRMQAGDRKASPR